MSEVVDSPVQDGYVTLLGEQFYRIHRYDQMPPFFMSIVSSGDHWLFLSSTGGLTAGRINTESALFPYHTDDKVAENSVNTGPLCCLWATRGAQTVRWEPFTPFQPETEQIERNLYKKLIHKTKPVLHVRNSHANLACNNSRELACAGITG